MDEETPSSGLDYKACTWLRDFLPIFPKIAVRQTVGGHGAAEGNSKPCKPFSPTQYKWVVFYFGVILLDVQLPSSGNALKRRCYDFNEEREEAVLCAIDFNSLHLRADDD